MKIPCTVKPEGRRCWEYWHISEYKQCRRSVKKFWSSKKVIFVCGNFLLDAISKSSSSDSCLQRWRKNCLVRGDMWDNLGYRGGCLVHPLLQARPAVITLLSPFVTIIFILLTRNSLAATSILLSPCATRFSPLTISGTSSRLYSLSTSFTYWRSQNWALVLAKTVGRTEEPLHCYEVCSSVKINCKTGK